MHDLPQDLLALLALVFALGVKHGLDPDHLATIDGLARFNATQNPWLAKWAGVFFSLGHGLIVSAVVVVVALMPGQFVLPGWLQELGLSISIATLLILGVMNLSVAFSSQQAIATPLGIKCYLRFQSAHPLVVIGIGALFALSFDTMTMATFFSVAAIHLSIESYAVVLGLVFTCGMIVSDGVNGLFTAHLVKQSAARARLAAKVMSFFIGSVSLLVAFMGVSRLLVPTLAEKIESAGGWSSLLVILWIATGFAVALLIARLSMQHAHKIR